MNIAKLIAFIKFSNHVLRLWWYGFADIRRCFNEKRDVTWSIRFSVFSGTGNINRCNRYNSECDRIYSKYSDHEEAD